MPDMDTPNPLQSAIDQVGLSALARECKVTHQAVRKWQAIGRLPRIEWTGETEYTAVIERATGGLVTKAVLLPLGPNPPPRRSQPPTPEPLAVFSLLFPMTVCTVSMLSVSAPVPLNTPQQICEVL